MLTMAFRYLAIVIITVGMHLVNPVTGNAQATAGEKSEHHKQVISANPFGWILVPWYNGEYERRVTSTVTVGLSGSRLPWGRDGGFYSVNAALRYYPNKNPFQGFYLGPRFGMFWTTPSSDMSEMEELSGVHIGLGFELGYAWLIGDARHLSFSVGGGATRIFGREPIPVIRLVNVGWAF